MDERIRKGVPRKLCISALRGNARVINHGMSAGGSRQELRADYLRAFNRICGNSEKSIERMPCDDYLAAGYPIALGFIAGARR